MKKLFLLMIAVAGLAACTVSRQTAEGRAAKAAHVAQRVGEKLDSMRFRVDVNYIYPRRGAARAVDFGYGIRLSGDTLYSRLPYFGRAYHVPYGGGKALDFTAPVGDRQVRWLKNGLTRVELRVTNDEDRYLYVIDVFDNGRVMLDVTAQEREQVQFAGEMVLDE